MEMPVVHVECSIIFMYTTSNRFKKYPEFATELDNGITLCGNHHALLQGKEESTNLQTIIEAVSKST